MRLHFRRLNKPGDDVPLVDNFSLEQDRHTFDDVTVVTIPVDDESDFAGKEVGDDTTDFADPGI